MPHTEETNDQDNQSMNILIDPLVSQPVLIYAESRQQDWSEDQGVCKCQQM